MHLTYPPSASLQLRLILGVRVPSASSAWSQIIILVQAYDRISYVSLCGGGQGQG